MAAQDVIINMNCAYVQGVIKAINDFFLEEATNCGFSEMRLENKIKKLKKECRKEREQMVVGGFVPFFGNPTTGKLKLVFVK